MGILNLTPDSFSDGGRFLARDAALAHAGQMVADGAAIIDIGGESTRPGAQPVNVEQELARVIPVIEALAGEIPVPISIDTSKAEVMTEAVSAGAGILNDVYALRAPGAVDAAARAGVPVCLMHMQGEPRTMQDAPDYSDVVAEVGEFLSERLGTCIAAGIPRSRILLDPGFGFGKTLQDNLTLLKNLQAFQSLEAPLLVGISRKSMVGSILGGAPVDERLHGSVAAAVLAVVGGAAIIRTHDVKATVDALKVVSAIKAVER
ncbi:MAG: dihydropteroate synthase [Candidatus Thiodiazotropha sp. (ex Monitilora ramsayi)]|nr:dihydropteroate synthase [Candidatus Thiodiazotropha sp. (ex Monitilora ramsayi)]